MPRFALRSIIRQETRSVTGHFELNRDSEMTEYPTDLRRQAETLDFARRERYEETDLTTFVAYAFEQCGIRAKHVRRVK